MSYDHSKVTVETVTKMFLFDPVDNNTKWLLEDMIRDRMEHLLCVRDFHDEPLLYMMKIYKDHFA